MGVARMIGLLREPAGPRRRALGYALAVAGPALIVAAFLPLRADVEPLTVGFAFLVVVVCSAAVGRLGPGMAASIVGFLAFNFFFIPPYGTFTIADPEHVVSLFVFLGLSALISFLFARAADRAEAAEERERELRTLQELSRELVVQGPGEETYRALLENLLREFSFSAAGLFVQQEGEGLVERLAVGTPAGALSPSWNPADPGRAPERLPLSVGSHNLGLIVLTGDRPSLTAPESRVLRALCDQLALVLERDRLLRRATEAEVLRQTDAVRRGMLATVSHDLRSPLAAIKASVTDLLDPDVEREEAERDAVLATIDAETDRLDSLVANLLDMSRIEAGALQARPEPLDLIEVVTAEVDAVCHRWPEVHVDVAIDERHGVATADPVFLPRVLSNLLDNAARAADRSPRPDVEVRGDANGAGIVVRVVDHGAGMDPAAREQLFYPFQRLQEGTSNLGPGLGLAIAKGFVQLMGGELWVEDTPGGGATFAFSLPEAAR
jgi:two-component system sensor histidine kinase KdpD